MNIIQNKVKISPEDKVKILALSRLKGFGPRRLLTCLKRFRSVNELVKAERSILAKYIPADIIFYLRHQRYLTGIDKYIKNLKSRGIEYITIFESHYPCLLKEIYDPPVVIYIKGNYRRGLNRCFSIVGTRDCSRYGIEVTRDIVRKLVDLGFTIVSGMAFGIDRVAHQEAVSNNGTTVAVLSGSADKPSPISNADIYREVLESGGCILSERHLGEEIIPGLFPARNRIISGLSVGTLVVEAGEKSGALITARLALEQGREVFSIPSNLYNRKGVGTNRLIKKGEAKLVQTIQDITDELGIVMRSCEKEKDCSVLDEIDKRIIDHLYNGPDDLDNMAELLNLDIATLNQKISILELDNKVAKVEGNMYVVIK